MKYQNAILSDIAKAVTVLLICIIAYQGFSQCEAGSVCEAREGKEEKEIEEYIREYYKAISDGDFVSLGEYITDEDELEEETLRMKALRTCGFVSYDVEDVRIYPLSDKAYWLAHVCTELTVEDLDVALPGAIVIMIGRKEDGSLYMVRDAASDDLSEDFIEEIREITLSDEIVDRTNEQAAKYNEILADNPDAIEWVQKASDAQTKALSEAYTRKAYQERMDGEEESYFVKKGDCLWSIAEQELGDGMYWTDIFEANRSVIGENPDLLYVGISLDLHKAAE